MQFTADLHVPFVNAIEQITEELRQLEHMLARHVSRLRRDGQFNEDPLRGLYIGDDEALAALRASSSDPSDDARIALGRAVLEGRERTSRGLPLPVIGRAFGLDRFERNALLIAAAPSLDRRYQTLFAFAQNDVARRLPSIDLVLALLVDDPAERLRHLARFSAHAPLRRGSLVGWSDADTGKPLAERALTVDDRMVMALLGVDSIDERIAPFVATVAHDPTALAEAELVGRCVQGLAAGATIVVFEGPHDVGQRAAACAACADGGQGLVEVDLDNPLARALPAELLGRLLGREALLAGCGLFLSVGQEWPQGSVEQVVRSAADLRPRLFLAARHGTLDLPELARAGRLERIELDRPGAAKRAGWWAAALPATASAETAQRLGRSSRIGPCAIARTVAAVDPSQQSALLAAVALHAAGQLPSIARRVVARWTWDDLVLADGPRSQLAELTATLVHWPRVTGDWGFSAMLPVAQNCIALFTGPSGTGKTMAASLIAQDAAMPLYRVDLSVIFNKYIGETEKQIDRLFDAAAEASAVLLFDEADALFGKRTALNDSHDRYANLSVAHLLQRVETYDGLAILTTNLPGNIDDAFARRLAHVIAFPMPDAAQRRLLWGRVFPGVAPLARDLDLDGVAATFEISGGNIRNAALAAAYLAASEGSTTIEQSHVLKAVARELQKIGRTPIAADFGDLQPKG